MKKVAITQRRVENESYPEIRDALDVRWADYCRELGILPVVLPTEYDALKYFDEFEISGIILTGGNDLSSVNPSPLSLKRDNFETSLVHYAVENSIPVLGICRGMQLIAEYFGGTIQRIEGHSGVRHGIVPRRNSRIFIGDSLPETVNSYHGYAVAKLPDCLHIVASDDTGVIEAFEHISLPVAAQMWHPERETPFNPCDLELAQQLFKL